MAPVSARLLVLLPLLLAALTACGSDVGGPTTWPDVGFAAAIMGGFALIAFASRDRR